MTKEAYTEFLNLQEHFEWLHAAEDRAKTKLETFTTDDSEFDELVHEAIKVYFETEIDKAWKKIEEFKTAPTFVADRADAIRYCSENGTTNAGYLKYAVFEHSDERHVSIPLDIIERAGRCCNEFNCDDPKNPCPFKEGGQYDWFRYSFDYGCIDIYERFHRGEYKIKEFKTATAKTGNVRGTVKTKEVMINGSTFKVSDIEEAKKVCGSGPCGHADCPLVGYHGCTYIWKAYDEGDYKEVD